MGSGALGSDLQGSSGIDPGDAAAAGADRIDFNGRDLEDLPGDLAFFGKVKVAVTGYGHVGAGAPHVDGNDVVQSGLPSQDQSAQGSGGGARQHHVHAVALGGLGGHDAAVGLHDMESRGDFQGVQTLLEPLEVAAHRGHYVGVDGRGAQPLELLELGQDVRRERDPGLRDLLPDPVPERPFVGRVHVGVQQANSDVPNFQFLQPAQQLSGGLLLQRPADLSGVEHALRDFEAALSRDQGLGTLLEVVVEAGPVLPHDVGHVPEPGGDQQGHLGPLALQDGVGGHGGAVNEEPHRLGGNLEPAQDPTGSLDDGRAGPIGRAGDLQQPEVSFLLVKADDVGKGSPDVDADSDGHDSPMAAVYDRPKPPAGGCLSEGAHPLRQEAPYCKIANSWFRSLPGRTERISWRGR